MVDKKADFVSAVDRVLVLRRGLLFTVFLIAAFTIVSLGYIVIFLLLTIEKVLFLSVFLLCLHFDFLLVPVLALLTISRLGG